MTDTLKELNNTAPFLILIATAFLLLICEIYFLKNRKNNLNNVISGTGVFLALYYNIFLYFKGINESSFMNSIHCDPLGYFLSGIILTGGLISIFASARYVNNNNLHAKEFQTFIIFSLSGMVLMVWSGDLLSFLIGLEITSICLYTLCGILSHNKFSREAALKYFVTGSFSSALFIFGTSLVYGATNSINYNNIAQNIHGMNGNFPTLLLAGAGLILAGLVFKISIVPFHMWTPDVYSGTATPVVAFMSVTVKTAVTGALMRILFTAFPELSTHIVKILSALAVVTMIFGNLGAMIQKDLKRLLAYSTIAHGGYILLGLVGISISLQQGNIAENGSSSSVVFYLLVYTFMNLGAFICVLIFQKNKETVNISDLKGIAHNHPVLAAVFSLFLLSLAGIPPASGFMGKFTLFYSAASAGLFYLVLIGVVNSLLSVYYYLKVIIIMYSGSIDDTKIFTPDTPQIFALTVTAAFTLYLGIFPGNFISEINNLIIKWFVV